MKTTKSNNGGSLERVVRRPAIGEMVIVHNYTPQPFKARVRDYHQCASNCIRVTRAHTTEEWIVMWQHCSPNDQAQRRGHAADEQRKTPTT